MSENSATIEVASNGYIVETTISGFSPQRSVYTNVVDALDAIARHVCYERIVIAAWSAPDSRGEHG